MVALSPKFAFLATLCTLTAISMAPLSDAAVLQLRASRPSSMERTSTFVNSRPGATASHDHYPSSTDSRADTQEDKIYAPLLSIPKPSDVPPKKKMDSGEGSGSTSDRKSPSGGDSHGEEDDSEGDESKHAEKEKAKVKGRRWNLPHSMKQFKDLLGDKMLGDYHVHSVRAPDHHHHHHHHHHHGRHFRSRMIRGLENQRVVSGDNKRVIYSRAPHHHHSAHEEVIVSGNRDHVHVGRSPHYYDHHHHHHDGHDKVIVSGDDDHVHVGRSPHHRHHHHNDEKVIVSGDGDHVHVHRSVSIAGEQGQSYIVPHVAKRAIAQESFSLPSLGKRDGNIDGAPGRIDIVSPVAESTDGRRIASLVLALSNSTSDNSTHSSEFVLNASEKNSTEMYLLPMSDSSSNTTFGPNEIGVTIRLPVFEMTSASTSPYCATFDPSPPAPAPLTAEECTDDPVGEHRSQLFAYNRDNGVVRPMWFNVQDDGTGSEKGDCSGDAPPTPQNADLAGATEVNTNSVTSTPSTAPGNSTVLSADIPQAAPSNSSGSDTSGVQKVALVFVAADPEVLDTPEVVTTTSSVLESPTGATADTSSTTMMASSSSSSLAAASPTVLASAPGSSSSVSAKALSSASSDAATSAPVSTGTPGSVPSSAAVPNSTATTVLGVQVVPTTEGNAPSTPSASATPVMTPVSTQPYEWMFKPNSRA